MMYDPVRDALMSNTTTTTTAATTTAAAAVGEDGRQRTSGEPMVLCENGKSVIVERTGYGGDSFIIGARGPAPTTDER